MGSEKILHITPYYIEQFGYQDNYLPYYQKRLGYDVKIATSDYYFPFLNYDDTMKPRLGERFVGAGRYNDNGVEIIRCTSMFGLFSSMTFIYFSVKEIINEFKPDVVQVHGITNMAFLEVFALQKKYKYRIFADSHTDNSNNPLDKLWRKIYYMLWKIYVKSINLESRIDGFLPITEDAKKWLQIRLGLSSEKMHISPLGVDTETMFYSKEESVQFREQHGITDKYILVYAGKQNEQKKVGLIIDIFRNLIELHNRKDVVLVLVGNPERHYEEVLQNKLCGIDGHCIRLPFLTRQELRAVYSAADIGLWPGAASNTIQEAMACGTALVLPDDKIVGHLIDGNGYLIDDPDAVRIAELINRTLTDKKLLNTMKEKSIEIAYKYSWESIARDLIKIYNS